MDALSVDPTGLTTAPYLGFLQLTPVALLLGYGISRYVHKEVPLQPRISCLVLLLHLGIAHVHAQNHLMCSLHWKLRPQGNLLGVPAAVHGLCGHTGCFACNSSRN